MGTVTPSKPTESALPAFRAQQNQATQMPLLAVYPNHQQEVLRILSTPIFVFSLV
jgi:hypothetical protein